MTLDEATGLVLQHRGIKDAWTNRWRWRRELILASMKEDIQATYNALGIPNYDKDSIIAWLDSKKKSSKKQTTIWLYPDVRQALDNVGAGKMSEFVNEAVREKLNA